LRYCFEQLRKYIAGDRSESKSKEILDKTLRNLVGPESKWHKLFGTNGKWVAMNAVWALRRSDLMKSRYLGDEIHKSAFPVWYQVLSHLKPKRVVVAGGWATFSKFPSPDKQTLPARDYFVLWRKFTSTPQEDDSGSAWEEDAQVTSCLHPSTWTWRWSGSEGPDKMPN
jgi:hypothetical protein